MVRNKENIDPKTFTIQFGFILRTFHCTLIRLYFLVLYYRPHRSQFRTIQYNI